MQEEAQRVRVLVTKEGDHWVAQCLEYDIGAQARDIDELRKRLLLAIEAERQETTRLHSKAFAGIGPAPESFHQRWDAAKAAKNDHALTITI